MACAWSTLGSCTLVDWAQIVGAFTGLLALVAALGAIPIALRQIGEDRRLHAITTFNDAFQKICALSNDTRSALDQLPGDCSLAQKVSTMINSLSFNVELVTRCERLAPDFIEPISMENIAYQVGKVGESMEKLLGASEFTATVGAPAWTEEFMVSLEFWTKQMLRNLSLLSGSKVAQGATGSLSASFQKFQRIHGRRREGPELP